MAAQQTYEQSVQMRISQEKSATEFIKAISDLFYERGVETVLFRNQLIDQRPSEILNLHKYARKIVGKNITIEDTLGLLKIVLNTDICPARFDIGRLAAEWVEEGDKFSTMEGFVKSKLADFIGGDKRVNSEPKDVVLYGFGRIGRLVARELIAQEGRGEQLRLRAIVTRGTDDATTLEKRASLLRVDSVHGEFPGTVEADVENNALIINGRNIQMISARQPEDIDYTKYGIHDALIIDNTGAFRDKEALTRHLTKGASKVLLTAPGKEVPNIVHGVNQTNYDPKEVDIFSAASCTTNAIVPVLKVMEDNFGVEKGHIETVHAYTNDQNLVDNMHSKYRRGRGAALNMVITETGAGKAASKALPSLEGKLTSNAIRVPVPNGSLAILNLTLNKETSVEELNDVMRNAALKGNLVEQINYSFSNELVSSDIVGNSCPSIFDSPATIVHPDGKSVVLYVWYDNEYGYSRQVIRLSKYIASVRRKSYY